MAEISGELDEVVLGGEVASPGSVLPPAANLADLPDQRAIEAEQEALPMAPVLSQGSWTHTHTERETHTHTHTCVKMRR